MRICGIIAEYNPFHNGHKYHLNMSKIKSNSDVVVAVMSGNFIQRGLPALFDKWTRTELALSSRSRCCNRATHILRLPVAPNIFLMARYHFLTL